MKYLHKVAPTRTSAQSSLFSGASAILPTALAVGLPLALVPQPPAQALSFRLDFGRDVPDDFQAVARDAADRWSAVLKDDVVVDLKIEYGDLSDSGAVLGGAQPGKVKVKYEDYVNALYQDSVSTTDLSALSSLPLSSEGREILQSSPSPEASKKTELKSEEFAFLMDGRFGRGQDKNASFIDNNGSANNKNVLLTKAQAKALGLAENKGKKGLDGLIKINSIVDWDTDRGDGIAGDRYDASSVLQHEIGHVLGIVSGVDALGFLAAATEPVDLDKNNFSYLTPMDFYRYSSRSAELGVADLTLGGDEKYFSLDGGKTIVRDENGQGAYFSTGSLSVGGDGYQGSHWKPSSTPLGVTSAVLKKGQTIDISKLDLTLLDSVGWNTEDNNAQRAAAIGLDWQQITGEIAQDRAALTSSLVQEWGDEIPALEAALNDAAVEADLKFQQKLKEKFDDLVKKAEEGKLKDREKEFSKFREEVQKEADKRNDDVRKLPEEIFKIDEEVREWLTLSTDKLSDKAEKANGAEINRLANIVKAAPAAERAELEPKLAAAFAQFSDKPDELLKDLLDNSGPSNPVAWGLNFRIWWFYQRADSQDGTETEEIVDPGFLYATEDLPEGFSAVTTSSDTDFSQIDSLNLAAINADAFNSRRGETQDVPEPSSVLALFGIAVLGAGAVRHKS